MWDDPRMPWGGEATAEDKRAWWAIIALGLYGIAMMPLRPIILGMSTYALATITGSAIAMVDIGAGIALGVESTWWLWLVIASLSIIKFDWIFWWAGKLWGHAMIEMIAGRSRWAARTARHAEALARRYGIAAVFIVGLIPFLPASVVYAFVGSAGMRLRTFLIVDLLSALVNRSIWMFLGYQIGDPAKRLVDLIDKYSWYIALAILAVIIIKSIRDAHREAKQNSAKRTAAERERATLAEQSRRARLAEGLRADDPSAAADADRSAAGEGAPRDRDDGADHR